MPAWSALWSETSERWIVSTLNQGKAFKNLSSVLVEQFANEKDLLSALVEDSALVLTSY